MSSSRRTARSCSTSSRAESGWDPLHAHAGRSRTTRSSATQKLTDMEKDALDDRDPRRRQRRLLRADPGQAERHPHAKRRARLCAAQLALEPRHRRGRDAHGRAASRFDGSWHGTGQRRQLDLNAPPVEGSHDALHLVVGTGDAGGERRRDRRARRAPAAATEPHRDGRRLSGPRPRARPDSAGGAVLVARGGQAPHLTAEAPLGTTVELRPTLTPNWSGMTSAIGGGPLLVTAGSRSSGARVLRRSGA